MIKSITIRDHNGKNILMKITEKNGKVDYLRHYMVAECKITVVLDNNDRVRFGY